jgi:integrase
MAIRKISKGWQVDVTDRGQNVRIRRNFSTQKEAKEAEAKIRLELKNAVLPKTSIERALEAYLTGEALSLKDYNSVKSKARSILPFIAGKSFDEIGQITDDIKRSMLGNNLKPATINRRLALLKRVTNLAFDWGWLEQPVARRVKLLPGEESRHYYLTVDQVQALADLCPVTGDIIRIAAYTGLRRGELFRLNDTNLKDDFIVLMSDTKTNKPRLIPIPDQIKELVKSIEWPLDSLFDYRLRDEFESARLELGLKHIRFHDLRHTYASLLAQAGATLQLIGKAMGHSTPVMTDRYAHLVADNLRDLADKFASLPASQYNSDEVL